MAPNQSWSAPGHTFTIDYPTGLLDSIRAEAVDGLYRIHPGGVEIGGVLFGSRTATGVRIEKFRPLEIGYVHGPVFHLSEKDEWALDELLRAESGLAPVGWYHSHTRSGVNLSEQDLEFYNRRFPEPWQVALVLRPTHLGPAEVGFFFREADGAVRTESSYNPFTIGPLTGTQAPAPREVVLPPLKAPAFTEPKDSGGSWMWLVTAIVLAGLGLGVLTDSIHISGLTVSRAPLNLRATDSNGAVRIEWDPAAEPIVEATGGTLLVLDGDKKVETPLSRQRLEEGNMVYRRQSPDVEIRLRVDGSGQEPIQEMALLIGLPAVSTPAPAPQQYAADRPKPLKLRPAATKRKRTVVSAHSPGRLEPQPTADPPRRSWLERSRLKQLNPVAVWRRIRN